MSQPTASTSPTPSKTAKPGSPAPSAKTSTRTDFIVLIRSKEKGTVHAVMSPKDGPGALATFEDAEFALNATTNIPACQKNEFFIVPVE